MSMLLIAVLAIAAPQPTGAAASKGSAAERRADPRLEALRGVQKDKRADFNRRLKEERKAFEESLKHKPAEEARRLRAEFRQQVKRRRREFNLGLRRERSALQRQLRADRGKAPAPKP